MSGFNLYHVNDFSDYNSSNKNDNLKLNLAFIEPLCYYHIYFNAPQQVMAGNNWNEKIALFFYQSFNHMNYHLFDYRDISAVKKWANNIKVGFPAILKVKNLKYYQNTFKLVVQNQSNYWFTKTKLMKPKNEH